MTRTRGWFSGVERKAILDSKKISPKWHCIYYYVFFSMSKLGFATVGGCFAVAQGTGWGSRTPMRPPHPKASVKLFKLQV